MTITLQGWQGKTVFIVGLGISGRAAIESFLLSGARVKIWDDDQNLCQELQRHYALRPSDVYALEDWQDVDALLPAPSLKLDHAAFSRANIQDCQILSDIDLLYRAMPKCHFIGITGTNGKSTTTALIAHILENSGREAVAGGNLGIAPLALPALDDGGYYVLELSSYQLHHIRHSQFKQAILLNITPDHLGYHGSMENYIEAKLRIFAQQREQDLSIIGVSTELSLAIAQLFSEEGRKLKTFSGLVPVPYGVYREGEWLLEIEDEGKDPKNIIHLPRFPHLHGRHNAENMAAAYLACRDIGLTQEEILSAMESFSGLVHRQEYLGSINQVHFINDSKATNSDAAQMALMNYPNIYWLAGGEVKDENLRNLLPYIGHVKAAFFYGKDAEKFYRIFHHHIPCIQLENMVESLQAAYRRAQQELAEAHKGSGQAQQGEDAVHATILLSPAAASFDQFANFMHRGDDFKKEVENIKNARC